jgi:hypothetical protein
VIADGAGRAVAFRIAPGQAHELPHAVPLLACLPEVPLWVVADRGLGSHGFREHIWNLGARPAIPPRRDEAPVACPEPIHNNRNSRATTSASRPSGSGRTRPSPAPRPACSVCSPS